MVKKLRPRLSYANVMATVACFIALGGTATATHLAVNGSDVVDESLTGDDIKGKTATSTTAAVAGTLTGADVKDASLTYHDIALSTIGGGRVLNNSLTGDDVSESTLSEVPSALTAAQGGIGRSGPDNVYCNPEGERLVYCAIVTLALPAPGRVLVSGRARASRDGDDDGSPGEGFGDCMLGSTAGAVTNGIGGIPVASVGDVEHVPLVALTDVLPAGTHSFSVNCEDGPGNDGMNYHTSVSAVALSAR